MSSGSLYYKRDDGVLVPIGSGGGSGGGGGFTFSQDDPPTATKIGDTWYHTATGNSFVWTSDGNSLQWVQFAPGAGSAGSGEGGSGFTFVQDTVPTPLAVGDTWFDLSTAASGGTSWVAVEEGAAGSELVWVQFAPGSGLGNGPHGIIASASNGGSINVPTAVGPTYLTAPALDVTFLVGRRYRLEWSFRATGRTDGAGASPVLSNIIGYDGTAQWGVIDSWYQFAYNWGSSSGFIYFVGDGVRRSVRLGMGHGGLTAGVTVYPTWFGIEDVGAI